MGDPFVLVCVCRFEKGCLIFGGPINVAKGELADWGLLSWGGEAAKHSSRDPKFWDCTEGPPPNLKGAIGLSTFTVFSDTDVVEWPFVRANEGRSKEDRRLLLTWVSTISTGASSLTYSM